MRCKQFPNVIAIAPIFTFTIAIFTTQAQAHTNDIETITISNTRSAQPLTGVSRSIALMTTDQIEATQVDHIQQLLNQEAGVFINRNSGQEMLLAIRSPVLSGAGACGSFLTMENGIPLRPTGFCNVNELFESHFELAERIEIIKGPSSMFYGSNGIHGVVNIIQPASISREPFIKSTFGEWDYQQLSFLANNENLAVSSSLTNSGGYRNDSGFTQQKLSIFHLAAFQEFDVETSLTATNLNQETAGYLVGKNSYKDDEVRRTNPNPEAYRDANSIRLSQRYSLINGWHISPFARYSEMEFLQHFVPGKPIEKNRHHSLGIQTQKQYQITEHANLNIGLDLEYSDMSLLEEQFSPTQGSAFLKATIPQGKHYDYKVETMTLAAFAGIEYQLSTTWQLDTGLRLEQINFDYTNKMGAGRLDEKGEPCGFGGCRFNRPESSKDSYTIASPKLGFIYQKDNYQGFINLSHGFRAPQSTELYRLQREQSISDLEPETIIALDGGWRVSTKNTQVNLQAYWYEKSDVILRDNNFFYTSDGKTKHQGIEFGVETELKNAFEISANFSYSRHTYSNNPNLSQENITGNEIANAPRWLVNVFARYQLSNWYAELHGQYVDEYFLNPENTASYAGHILLHARAMVEITQKLKLNLNVENLTDRYYAERANYTSFTQERYFPGLPRNIKASITYTF
ncbi:TonB-dependent receptor [Colwellia sp. MEBiC06753]